MPAPAPPSTPAGAALRGYRRELGMTQTQFAEAIGFQQATISRVEVGDRPMTAELAWTIERTFELDPGTFLEHVRVTRVYCPVCSNDVQDCLHDLPAAA